MKQVTFIFVNSYCQLLATLYEPLLCLGLSQFLLATSNGIKTSSLEINHTFELSNLPSYNSVIDYRWIIRLEILLRSERSITRRFCFWPCSIVYPFLDLICCTWPFHHALNSNFKKVYRQKPFVSFTCHFLRLSEVNGPLQEALWSLYARTTAA